MNIISTIRNRFQRRTEVVREEFQVAQHPLIADAYHATTTVSRGKKELQRAEVAGVEFKNGGSLEYRDGQVTLMDPQGETLKSFAGTVEVEPDAVKIHQEGKGGMHSFGYGGGGGTQRLRADGTMTFADDLHWFEFDERGTLVDSDPHGYDTDTRYLGDGDLETLPSGDKLPMLLSPEWLLEGSEAGALSTEH